MFGAFYFGQLAFASALTIAAPAPAAANKTGYPFGDSVRVPSARVIPDFDHVRALEQDEEDVLQLTVLWLTRK